MRSYQLIATRCNVNLQTKDRFTTLHVAVENDAKFGVLYRGHVVVTTQSFTVLCYVDLQDHNDITDLELAEGQGHTDNIVLISRSGRGSGIPPGEGRDTPGGGVSL